jgi:hypothetical protein
VGVPVGLFGESLVDAVVEVLVVGEDNVATDIVELSMLSALLNCVWESSSRYSRSPQGLRRSRQDRREPRWSRQSSMTGR